MYDNTDRNHENVQIEHKLISLHCEMDVSNKISSKKDEFKRIK